MAIPLFVTVEQVNNALRLGLDLDIDPSGPDADPSRLDDIELKITQAQDIVIDYIKKTEAQILVLGWTSPTTVAPRVSAAIILTIKCLLDDTEESNAMLSGLSGTIEADARNPITALLWRLRDPALA